jgi:multiple sugar transport system permease protein
MLARRHPTLSAYGKTLLGLAITAVVLFPILWIISASFQTTRQLSDITPHVLPPTPTLVNYREVLQTQLGPLETSLIVATLTAALSLVIAVPAAYALAAFSWRWTALVVFVVLVTQMIPSVMIATPLYLLFNKLHLLNTYSGLVLADSSMGIPFAVLLLRAFFGDVPAELREASLVDGAGEFRTLLFVMLPLARTAIISAGVFCFLFAWGDFLYALTLNTNGTVTPLSLSIYGFFDFPIVNWGGLMAAAVLAIVPGAVLLVLAQRYIAAGLTAGAVKG